MVWLPLFSPGALPHPAVGARAFAAKGEVPADATWVPVTARPTTRSPAATVASSPLRREGGSARSTRYSSPELVRDSGHTDPLCKHHLNDDHRCLRLTAAVVVRRLRTPLTHGGGGRSQHQD